MFANTKEREFGGNVTSHQQNKHCPVPGAPFQSPQAGIFGQATATQQPQQQSSMFKPSTSSNIFGAAPTGFGMALQTGTTIKFQPVTGTDSMQKSGSTTVINIKHQCITCMKEYEDKSFEELRMEDYAANREGPRPFGRRRRHIRPVRLLFSALPTPPNIFGNPPFGTTPTSSATGFGGCFDATQSQTAFGQAAGGGFFYQDTAASQAHTLFINKPAPQTGEFLIGTQPESSAYGTRLFQPPKSRPMVDPFQRSHCVGCKFMEEMEKLRQWNHQSSATPTWRRPRSAPPKLGDHEKFESTCNTF